PLFVGRRPPRPTLFPYTTLFRSKICEIADPDQLYEAPAHPYTAALLSAIPVPDPDAPARSEALVAGDLPSPVAPPSGCRFRTRRSEEHTSELQSRENLVCRLLLE